MLTTVCFFISQNLPRRALPKMSLSFDSRTRCGGAGTLVFRVFRDSFPSGPRSTPAVSCQPDCFFSIRPFGKIGRRLFVSSTRRYRVPRRRRNWFLLSFKFFLFCGNFTFKCLDFLDALTLTIKRLRLVFIYMLVSLCVTDGGWFGDRLYIPKLAVLVWFLSVERIKIGCSVFVVGKWLFSEVFASRNRPGLADG